MGLGLSRSRPKNPVVEGSIEDPRILNRDVQCQGSDWDVWRCNKLNERCWSTGTVAAFTVGDQSYQRVRWATSGAKCLARSTGPQPWPCRGGVREDTQQNVRTRQSTRQRGRCTTRHHNAAQLSTARVGALRPMPIVWASGHGWVPAGHLRYTRAAYDQEAVGGSTSRARPRDTSHRHRLWGWRPNSLIAVRVQSTRNMAAEHPQHVSGARVQSTEASTCGSAPATALQDVISLILHYGTIVIIQSGFFQHIYHIACPF